MKQEIGTYFHLYSHALMISCTRVIFYTGFSFLGFSFFFFLAIALLGYCEQFVLCEAFFDQFRKRHFTKVKCRVFSLNNYSIKKEDRGLTQKISKNSMCSVFSFAISVLSMQLVAGKSLSDKTSNSI